MTTEEKELYLKLQQLQKYFIWCKAKHRAIGQEKRFES